MKNELLILIRKHTDGLFEQITSRPQETLEFILDKQMETFSLNPPINISEEGKWLVAVKSLRQRIKFLIKLMKTIVFQLAHPVIRGFPTTYPMELLIN